MSNTTLLEKNDTTDIASLRNAEPLENQIAVFQKQITSLEDEAAGLQVTGLHELEKMEAAKEVKKKFVKLRNRWLEFCKEKKEYFLTGGRKIDAARNQLLLAIEPIEKWIGEQADFAKIHEEKRQQELHNLRLSKLTPFDPLINQPANLGALSETDWEELYGQARIITEVRIERDEKERQRLDEERRQQHRERLEAQSLREENERQLRQIEQERRDAAAKVAAVQAAADEAAARERKRVADEQAVINAENERKLRAERAIAEEAQRKADQLIREDQQRREAIALDAMAQAVAASEERERQEAATDKEKINRMIAEIQEAWVRNSPEKGYYFSACENVINNCRNMLLSIAAE